MSRVLSDVEWESTAFEAIFEHPRIERRKSIKRLRDDRRDLLRAVDGLLWLANNKHNRDDPMWWDFFDAAVVDAREAHAKARRGA